MFRYLWLAIQITSVIETLKSGEEVNIDIKGIKVGNKKARLIGVISCEDV